MKVRMIFRVIGLCAVMLAVSSLWFAACASGGGSNTSRERGLEVENADITVFPQLGQGNSNSVAFSPDGKHVLSGSWDNTIKLYDIATGRELMTFSGHTGAVSSVAFSPDGRQILSASGYGDCTVKLWDAATGREIRTFPGLEAYNTNSTAFSPDGKQIIFEFYNDIKSFDTATGREMQTFSGHKIGQINSVVFSPDGKQIISGSNDGTVRLWDVATGKEIAQFISFSGRDTQLAAASWGLTVETQTAATSNEGEWLTITPDGYFNASPRGDRYLNVRVNNTVSGIDSYR